MNLLFDLFGLEGRGPEIDAAIAHLAGNCETGRGAVFTRSEVVSAILDLSGYTSDRPLHQMSVLEPSFGSGEFLFAVVDRLLDAYQREKHRLADARSALSSAIRAVELHRNSFEETATRVRKRLRDAGIDESDAAALVDSWLVCDDFLLTGFEGEFEFVVGNPPYVRQERIPAPLLSEYRNRYSTLYDRADLYVPFFERALDLLSPGGTLGFICANRWLKNKYGGPLRAKIAEGFDLVYYIDMEGVEAFHSDVIAYPAITVVRRPTSRQTPSAAPPTRAANAEALEKTSLMHLVTSMRGEHADVAGINDIVLARTGNAPWLFDDALRLSLVRRFESDMPTLEQAQCKVGIGVATGCDRVFIADINSLAVEDERKVPLVMARDLVDGEIRWGGKGVLNPFERSGKLVDLDAYPQFAKYLNAHHQDISDRHVARKNTSGWYRTIDRIYPELVGRPKLLIPDIKGEATFVLDAGNYYPHHNLYYITSDCWELRALQAVLRSSVTVMMVATYCTRMAGGFLRFQAQYLRRIRVPHWKDVTEKLRGQLAAVAQIKEQRQIDDVVFQLYALNAGESEHIRTIAAAAQVTTKNRIHAR